MSPHMMQIIRLLAILLICVRIVIPNSFLFSTFDVTHDCAYDCAYDCTCDVPHNYLFNDFIYDFTNA